MTMLIYSTHYDGINNIYYTVYVVTIQYDGHTREQPLLYTVTIQYTIQTPLACERLKLISEDPLPTAALLHHINCSSEISTLFKTPANRCLAKSKSWHPFCTLKTRSRFSTFVKWPKCQNYGQLVWCTPTI